MAGTAAVKRVMPTSPLRLRFPLEKLAHWAARFGDVAADLPVERIGAAARARGHLTKPEFLALCYWKTPRTQAKVKQNTPDQIQVATSLALSTDDERAKIGVLRLLQGVSWPTASVILHFCAAHPYPILDVNALWSVGIAKPVYSYELWDAYTAFARELSGKSGLSMRDVDRALWAYCAETRR